MPNESILSEALKARTKPSEGEPIVTLEGVDSYQVPVYDSDGNRIGTKEQYSLLVYPDTVSTVSVSVTGKLKENPPKYQWQKLGQKGWTDIEGATASKLEFANSGYAVEGDYRCRVNSIYENELTGDIYYITSYSDVFTVKYSMRKAQVVSFAADRNTRTVSITLKSLHDRHYYAPTGMVTFHIEGQDYDQYFTAALRNNTSDYTSTATLNLAGSNGPNLEKGAFKITAYYAGSRVFQALDVGQEVYYVADNTGGYILNIDRTSYYYGDPIKVELLHVYVDSNNNVVIDPVNDGITYSFGQLMKVKEGYYWFTRTYYIYTSIGEMEADNDGNLKANMIGDNFRLEVHMGSDTVHSDYFRISKRPITVGFENEFYAVYSETESVKQVTLGDIDILEGNFAFGNTIANLNLIIKYYDQNNKEVNFNSNPLPGVYEVRLVPQGNNFYDITCVPTKYHIVSARYGLSIVSQMLDGEIVGTVELVTPSKVTLIDGTTVSAATTPTNSQWSQQKVIPGGMDLVFRANPQTGYRLLKWIVQTENNGITTRDEYDADSNIFTYKILAVENTIVTAVFDYTQYRFYYTSNNAGGTVEPVNLAIKSGSIVQPGASLTFIAKPAPGYHFVEWMLSGSTNSNFKGTINPDTGESTATVRMGSRDTILTAVFERDNLTLMLSEVLIATYTVQNETGDWVKKTGTGTIVIPGDTPVKITLKPGYSTESGEWYVNGKRLDGVHDEYDFTITEDTVVDVPDAKPGRYSVALTISPDKSDNRVKVLVDGIITDLTSGPAIIPGGAELEFIPQPARGYVFEGWETIDAENTDKVLDSKKESTFKVEYLHQNIIVKAIFVEDTVKKTVTITCGNNGSLNYTIINKGSEISEDIEAGKSATITVYTDDELAILAVPAKNYMLRSWMVNGETVNNDGSNSISFSNISDDMNISARFIPTSFAIVSFSASSGGSVSAAYNGTEIENNARIGNGGELVMTAVPDSGKMVEGWTCNGVPITNEDGMAYIGEVLELNPFFGEGTNDFRVSFTDLEQYSITINASNAAYDFAAVPEAYTGKTADSGNKHYARKGSMITLVITPDEGYRIDSVTVKDDEKYPDEDGKVRLTITDLTGNLEITASVKPILTVTIIPQNASAVKGKSVKLSATVLGAGSPSQEVTWNLLGNTSEGTYISQDGLLTVGADEEATELIVTAISEDSTASATITVTIKEPAPEDTKVTITPETALVEKGQSLVFTAKVIGTQNPSQEVTWSLSGKTSDNTVINGNGVLIVALDETATELEVTANSKEHPDVSATAIVTVTEPSPVVTGITITPGAVSVPRGTAIEFKAVVTGMYNPSQDVTWSLDGNGSSDTTISENGLLTVAMYETAETLTVTATSDEDRNVSATVTVTITSLDPIAVGIIITPGSVSVEKGKSISFSAAVIEMDNQSVTWNISGHSSSNTQISEEGILTVGDDETAETLTVIATSEEDTSITAAATVTITTPKPIVTAITITPLTASVETGRNISFSAVVEGINSPSQDVIWNVSGNNSTDTDIDDGGLLTVGNNETAKTLIVIAISTVEPKVSATVIVTVIRNPAYSACVVRFDSNGGDTEATPDTMTVTAGESLGTLPKPPVRSGYTFIGWNTKPDGRGTTYTADTRIDTDITLYAQWKANSSGGGGTGGGSITPGGSGTPGGGSGGTHPSGSAPVSSDSMVIVSDNSVTVVSKTASTVDQNGTARAAVTHEQMASAVSAAVAEATKQNGTARVEIKVEAPTNTTSVEASIPKEAVKSTNDGKIEAVTLSTHVAAITFDRDALSTIADEAADDVRITASKAKTEDFSEEVKQAVGDRPVFEFRVTSGSKAITRFNGTVTVSVPYTPKEGEDTNAIVIYYINSEGKPEAVTDCVYDPTTGTVRFTTNHFSRYAVGYNKVTFSDVPASAWYYKAVTFAAARGITAGTGNDRFSPDEKLTRGQFIVMLMKACGIAPDSDHGDNFADAGNTWYTGYLAAAKRLGITSGVGNNMFAPDKEITRQEMFTLLYRTLKLLGRLPKGTTNRTLASFTDANDIATWAAEAMAYLVEAGIVSGSDGKLLPTDTTTRAQMAAVLYSLLSKVN